MRIGILGAARSVPYALIKPAARRSDVTIAALASRSSERASKLASVSCIPRLYSSYDELIEERDIDAVYIALPTAWHPTWTLRALERGKHVLCEKPLAPNSEMAQKVAASARKHGVVLSEGMHLLHLDGLAELRRIISGGMLGRTSAIHCTFRYPDVEMIENDFRLEYELGGGAGLDVGCYAAASVVYLAGEHYPMVSHSRAQCVTPQVDGWMQADLEFPSGLTASIEVGFRGDYSTECKIEVVCERGRAVLTLQGLDVITDEGTQHKDVNWSSTYDCQLETFIKQTRGEADWSDRLDRTIATSRILEAMYEKSGLAPRISTPV